MVVLIHIRFRTIDDDKQEKEKSQQRQFMWTVRRCTEVDKIRNQTIKSSLNMFSINGNTQQNKTKRKDNTDRMVEKSSKEGNGLSADKKQGFGQSS